MDWYGNYRTEMSAAELNRVSVFAITSGPKPVRLSATEWSTSRTEYYVSFVVGRVSDYENLLKQRDAAIQLIP
jgi:hypothetical protein